MVTTDPYLILLEFSTHQRRFLKCEQNSVVREKLAGVGGGWGGGGDNITSEEKMSLETKITEAQCWLN